MYIQDAIEAYLEWKAGHTQRAPINYRVILRHFAEYTGIKRIEDITLDDIVKYQGILMDHFEMSYVAVQVVVIKNFFKFLRATEHKTVEPMLIRSPRFEQKRRAVAEESDVEKILKQLSSEKFEELQKMVIVRLLFETGMRVSELCSMNVADIESDKTVTTVITKKNGQVRWIMWSRTTHDLLLKYLGTRICLNQQPHLFVGNGGRVTQRTVQRWIKDLCYKAKITKPLTPHSFRHGKAHYILAKGGNVKHVQIILGHSERNPAASFAYLRMEPGEFVPVAKKYIP